MSREVTQRGERTCAVGKLEARGGGSENQSAGQAFCVGRASAGRRRRKLSLVIAGKVHWVEGAAALGWAKGRGSWSAVGERACGRAVPRCWLAGRVPSPVPKVLSQPGKLGTRD
ncbi:uncharacterized protein B0I36DRAFT_309572 [Microdochium trichocladiopsis]|uniref:Uncharacterized protein n=1 Tax=Microdochium trichocladiopsis TaxID=1682393 RepID=A0A9P9BZA3_9PEZI|nr:uncharacterized protein B0I36DRAFT_309572 [Microdochium trichocladiopsis]KAH7039899.1 hypothetical protein B0I36DRAFT_309572 [Microdochium trichocladiopsis]